MRCECVRALAHAKSGHTFCSARSLLASHTADAPQVCVCVCSHWLAGAAGFTSLEQVRELRLSAARARAKIKISPGGARESGRKERASSDANSTHNSQLTSRWDACKAGPENPHHRLGWPANPSIEWAGARWPRRRDASEPSRATSGHISVSIGIGVGAHTCGINGGGFPESARRGPRSAAAAGANSSCLSPAIA